MNAGDLTALVHLIGFATGIILYGMLGLMTRRHLAYVDAPGESRYGGRLALAAAVLGVIWNVGAMVVYAIRDFGIGEPLTWLSALSYAALGFLPAVVVHSTLNRSTPSASRRWLLAISYTGSAVAAALHVVAATHGELLSSSGLLLLTSTYAVVLVALAATERGRPGFRRTITAAALAAFAVSALHLSRHPGLVDQAPWPVELVGHHASLPLVLAILYQDYRFAFADLFLKRALSLLALVLVVALLYALLAAPLIDPHAILARHAVDQDAHLATTASLLALWIATALFYPFIQRRAFRFVDRVVLRRADYRDLRAESVARLAASRTQDEALNATCALLGRALDAESSTWRIAASPPIAGHPTIMLDAHRTEACIVIPATIEPHHEIVVAGLRGGRTLLSDDLMLIDAVAAVLGHRLDEIRLDEERVDREQREQEMMRLATEAELRALRAQLNPHFLFNTLNTLGHLMQAAPDRALSTLYRLTSLLRAVLRRTNRGFVALGEEVEIVESYLAIERERFEERLAVTIDVPAELRHVPLPPLLLQPLVENAVKHGIAPMREGGRVTVQIARDAGSGDGDGHLRILIIDTGRGVQQTPATRDGGVGLSNIEARLRYYYGPAAAMSIRPTPGGGTTVELSIPLASADTA